MFCLKPHAEKQKSNFTHYIFYSWLDYYSSWPTSAFEAINSTLNTIRPVCEYLMKYKQIESPHREELL